MPGTEPLLSVVIPAFNEAESIEGTVKSALSALDAQPASYEVLLVDDGSGDGTLALLRAMEGRHAAVRVMVHPKNRGLGAALRTGFENSRGEFLTWIPGDGQFDLREVLTGLPLLREHDVVVALRDGVRRSWRIMITWCFHIVTWILFRFDASDMCGIYLIRRSAWEGIHPKADNIFYNLEVPMLCVKQGKRLGRIRIKLLPRLLGVSKVSNARTMSRNLLEMAKICFGRE